MGLGRLSRSSVDVNGAVRQVRVSDSEKGLSYTHVRIRSVLWILKGRRPRPRVIHTASFRLEKGDCSECRASLSVSYRISWHLHGYLCCLGEIAMSRRHHGALKLDLPLKHALAAVVGVRQYVVEQSSSRL